MKKLIIAALLGLAASPFALAQEPAAKPKARRKG